MSFRTDLAGSDPVRELGIGAGRLALPMRRRGVREYDIARQIPVSHHHWTIDGELTTFSTTHRYLWSAELDLMARLAGMTLRERWAHWDRGPLSSESRSHISVWEKPGYLGGSDRA